MLRQIPAALFLISASFAFAQSDANSVTVTASRAITPQPDQALFSVSVTSGLTTTLDDVLAAVQPAGITLASFSSVSTSNAFNVVNSVNMLQLQWTFALTGALANTTATIATLTSLQSTAAKANPSLSVSFSLQGTQVSAQAAQSQTCSLPGLLSDANAKAQALAAAANRFVSGILALATSTSHTNGVPSHSCSITVKYSLVGS